MTLTDEHWQTAVANEHLARRFLQRYRHPDAREEAWADAMLGLAHAARLYDPAKGTFSTFARYKMLAHVTEGARTRLDSLSRSLRRRGEDLPAYLDAFEPGCVDEPDRFGDRERIGRIAAALRADVHDDLGRELVELLLSGGFVYGAQRLLAERFSVHESAVIRRMARLRRIAHEADHLEEAA